MIGRALRVGFCFCCLGIALLAPKGASADCTNPAGIASHQFYNTTYNVMQYCNGADWVNMGAPAAPVDPVWNQSGSDIYYSSGNVGIGTASPGYELVVGSGGADSLVTNSRVNVLLTGANGSAGLGLHNTGGSSALFQLQSDALYAGTASSHPIHIRTDDVNRVTIDVSGYVGIGETSPQDKLHVAGQFRIDNDTDGTNKGCIRYNGSTNKIQYSHDCSTFSDIGASAAETDPQVGAVTNAKWCRGDGSAVQCDQNAPSGGDNLGNHTATANIQLGANWLSGDGGNEGLRVDASGNVGIGTASPADRLVVTSPTTADIKARINSNGDSYAGLVIENSSQPWLWQVTPTTDTPAGRFRLWNSGERLTILPSGNVGIGTTSPSQLLHVNGTAYATTFLHTSDRRLKTEITPIEDALELVSRLQGVHFKWKADGKPAYGVIAQDVESAIPDAVTTNSDGTKAVDYDQLIAPLIEAVKAQQQEIEALRTELDDIRDGRQP